MSSPACSRPRRSSSSPSSPTRSTRRWPGDVHTAGYLPVLIERFVRKRLEFAREAQLAVDDVPEVLFVCVHNAGRSQMAVALLEHHGHGRMHARSGGSAPTDRINPSVVAAMEEIGLDVSREVPKPVTDEMVKAADVVITMGCGDVCPVYPGKHYQDWVLEDPAGRGLEAVRPIRDEIDRRVRALLADLA